MLKRRANSPLTCASVHVQHITLFRTLERWFRTLKSEGLRNAECSTPRGLEMEVAGFVEYYDNERTRQSLGCETPTNWCCGGFLTAAWATGFGWVRISCQIRAATLTTS